MQRKTWMAEASPVMTKKSGVLPQQCVELRLNRTDRNEVAAGAFIDAVEMGAAVEKIAFSPLGPSARGGHVEEHRHQRCCAVAHRGIDHLSLAGFFCFQQ